MTDEELTRLINDTVHKTVDETVYKLTTRRLLKDDQKTGIEKIEGLLRYYPLAKRLTDDKYAQRIVKQLDTALEEIKDDPYYDIIVMSYFHNDLRETIADAFGTSVTTISRNKKRLLVELEKRITPSDFIIDLLNV